jgi:hypothetical protein
MTYYPRTGNLAVRSGLAFEVAGLAGDECGEDLGFAHDAS